MEECIFHSDKLVFDNVRKDLQKAKVFPRIFGPRLAMTVCSCRKHETSLDREIDEDIAEKLLVLSTELNFPKWTKFPTTQTYLRDLIDCKNLSISQKKLILVIDKALDKDFEALKDEFRKERLEEINRNKNCVKKPRFNHIGLANIIRKKQNRYPVKREAILPIFGGNSKSLESKAGKGFVKVGKTFDCVVRFESDKTRKFMDEQTPKTVVVIWCQSVKSFEEISQHLCLIAEEIQSHATRVHEIRKEKRKELKTMRKLNCLEYSDGGQSKEKAEDIKEKRSDDFWKKQNKDKKHKKFGQMNKEELSPLRGSHCMNCFKEFESLKAEGNEECKYHKGYISFKSSYREWEWSCCSLSSMEKLNTYEVHKKNGCQTGRHLWRPHAKASRGDKSEKMFMQKMLKQM